MPLFQQSDHFTAKAALADGHVLVLLLSSGPVVLVALGDHNPIIIRGTEPDGSRASIFAESLLGWSIAPPSAYAPAEEPEAAPAPAPDAEAAYLEQWQAAFMALRAACDKSEDPDVTAAVANLEAIEVLPEQAPQ